MPNTIDERVVEMKFNNAQFEQNVSKSMSTIEKLEKSLQFKGIEKGFENINTAAKKTNLSPISDAVESVKLKFSALEIVGITTLTNLTNSAVNMAKKMASALTIEPIKTGFQEYETQLNSTQTILANTQKEGAKIEDVNAALDELNHYADLTIYNFTEMTRNIGTFTAAGVKLKTSVESIQGIANLAAVSGSTSQQASAAMYQLSQALASGTVKLMDWNSVVNAGMGGQVFQDALKETARLHGVAIDQMIADEGSFRESLKNGWLTADILTETLKKFTTSGVNEYLAEYTGKTVDSIAAMRKQAVATGDQETAFRKMAETLAENTDLSADQIYNLLNMSQTAEEAATKVKTLSQLWDVLKEAAQSGWSASWRIIMGDYEEAKETLTKVSDTLSNMISASADARNKMLTDWKVLGGRTEILEGIRNAFENVSVVIKSVNEAFRDVFPKITAKQLENLSRHFKQFTERIKLNEVALSNLKNTFRGLFTILNLVKNAIIVVFKVISPVISVVSDLIATILAVTGYLGSFIYETVQASETMKHFSETSEKFKQKFENVLSLLSRKIIFPGFEKLLNIVSALIKPIQTVKQAFTALFGIISQGFEKFNFETFFSSMISNSIKLIERLGNAISSLLKTFFDGITNGDVTDRLALLNGLVLMNVGNSIVSFLKETKESFKGFGSIGESVKQSLDTVKDVLVSWQTDLKANALKSIAIAIGILAGSLLILSSIDTGRLVAGTIAIRFLISELSKTIDLLKQGAMDESLGSVSKTIITMIGVATAVLILSSALKKISSLDFKGMLVGLSGVGGLLYMIVETAKAMDTESATITKFAGQMVILSIAIKMLSSAMISLGNQQWDEIVKGFAGVASLTGILVIATKYMDTANASVTKFAGQMLILSVAVSVLSNSVSKLGALPVEQLEYGFLGIAGIITTLIIATKAMDSSDSSITKFAGQMLIMSGAIAVLSGVVKVLGNMGTGAAVQGILSIAGVMTVLVASCAIMANVNSLGILAFAGAMAVLSGSLALLTPSLLLLGSAGLSTILVGLLGLAGAITIFGAAAFILTPVIPIMIGLGAAIALLGAGIVATGSGLLSLAAGITALAAASTANTTAAIATINMMITGIIGLIPLIVAAIGEGIVGICGAIAKSAKSIGAAVSAVALALIGVITDVAQPLADAVMTVILAILTTIDNNVTTIINILFSIWTKIITGLFSNVVKLWNTFIDSKLGSMFKKIVKSFVEAGKNVVTGFISGIKENIDGVIDKAKSMASMFLSAFSKKMKIQSPSKEMEEKGEYTVLGYTGGVEKNLDKVDDAAGKMGDTAINKLDTFTGEFENMASKHSDVYSSSLLDGVKRAAEQARSIGLFAKSVNMPNGGLAMSPDYVKKTGSNAVKNAFVNPGTLMLNKFTNPNATLDRSIKDAKKKNKELEEVDEKINDTLSNIGSGGSKSSKGSGGTTKELKEVKTVAKEAAEAIVDYSDYFNVFSYAGEQVEKFHKQYASTLDTISDIDPVQASKNAIELFALKLYSNTDKMKTANKEYQESVNKVLETEMTATERSKKLADLKAEHIKKRTQEIQETYETYVKSVKDGIQNDIDMLSEFKSSDETTMDTYLDNMQSQIDALNTWEYKMRELAKRDDMTPEMFQYLINKGFNGGYNLVNELFESTDDQFEEFKDKFTRLANDGSLPNLVADSIVNSMAGLHTKISQAGTDEIQQAVYDMDRNLGDMLNKVNPDETLGSKLKDSMKSSFNTAIEEITDNTEGYKEPIKTAFTSIGDAAAMGMYVGIKNGIQYLFDPAKEMGETIKDATMDSIDAHSPSRDFMNIGGYIIDGLVIGIKEGIPSIENAMTEVGMKAKEAFSNILGSGNFLPSGKEIVTYIADGVTEDFSNIKKAITYAIDKVRLELSSLAHDRFHTIGEQMVQGMIDGIMSKIEDLKEAARELAEAAESEAEDELDINSPSKKFFRIGSFTGEGFVNGLKSYVGTASRVAGRMADDTISVFTDSVRALANAMVEDYDEPTITPVLDLSEIQNGSKAIGSLLDKNSGFNLSATSNSARMAARDFNSSNSNPAASSNGAQAPTYSFTQNNYSPKALSRIDIYRQTKNQFSALKGTT